MVTFSKLGEPLYGRLGNQLFQIAATIGIAKKNGHEFVFPQWEYLKYFKNKLPIAEVDNFKPYNEKQTNYYNVEISSDNNWDLRGFFPSEKFFSDSANLVRYYFEPSSSVSDYISEKYSHLFAKKTCSVHVRRGDYLNQRIYFPIQPLEYYNSAIAEIGNDFNFIFFSDDIMWCRQNFFGSNFHFIENEIDIIDLFLMSYCTNHILSNSSFSWWGAWLNKFDEKKIICPEYWFGPASAFNLKTYYKDIFSDNFEKLILPKKTFFHKYNTFCYPIVFIYYKVKTTILNLLRPMGDPIKKQLLSIYNLIKLSSIKLS